MQHASSRLDPLLQSCRSLPLITTAVVNPTDPLTLEGLSLAVYEQLIDPLLVGPPGPIAAAARKAGIEIGGWELVEAPDAERAASIAAELAALGRVQAIMKGCVHTRDLLAPLVDPESGLVGHRRLSHCYVLDAPSYHKPLLITDAVVNISPNLGEKADICRNAIDLVGALGLLTGPPKIALLSAVELVTDALPSTLEAAALCKMAERGQITGALIDGPLALDNALSREAASAKGIRSAVAGDADILVAPAIEAANILAKQFAFMGKASAGGLVMGGRVPVMLNSRAEGAANRLLSCAMGVLLVEARREGRFGGCRNDVVTD